LIVLEVLKLLGRLSGSEWVVMFADSFISGIATLVVEGVKPNRILAGA
jgi:uncharacterized membrane protein